MSNSFIRDFNLIAGDKLGATQNLKLEITNNDLPAEYNMYLLDRETGYIHLLNDGAYSFIHTAISDDDWDQFPSARFEIQITTETLGESEKIETASIKLVNKGNAIEFAMPSTSGIESVQFVGLNGQVVKTVQAYKGQTEFDVANFNSGVYIAQLKLESGNVASYKFVR